VQVDPIKPAFKAPGTKRLKLICGEQLSNFAFNFNLRNYNEETGPSTPIFFILFPGYSPSKEIETLARDMGKTSENGQRLTLVPI